MGRGHQLSVANPSILVRFAVPGGGGLASRAWKLALAVSVLSGAGCYRATTAPAPAEATGRVVLPPGYDPSRTYPVVEILPPTGNTAEALLQIYLSRVGLGRLYREDPERQIAALLPYLVPDAGADHPTPPVFILASGRGNAADYRTAAAWSRTIARYEQQVRADLRAVAARHRVDTSRFVVAGFSMGGDLAWALTLRNPDLLHGAIVMASRASYRPSDAGAAAPALRRARFFLTMGAADDPTRRRLALAAAALLERLGVAHEFRMIEGAGHEPAPVATFAEALRYVLRRDGGGE